MCIPNKRQSRVVETKQAITKNFLELKQLIGRGQRKNNADIICTEWMSVIVLSVIHADEMGSM